MSERGGAEQDREACKCQPRSAWGAVRTSAQKAWPHSSVRLFFTRETQMTHTSAFVCCNQGIASRARTARTVTDDSDAVAPSSSSSSKTLAVSIEGPSCTASVARGAGSSGEVDGGERPSLSGEGGAASGAKASDLASIFPPRPDDTRG